MARIFDNEHGYFYEVDGFEIELNEASFSAFQHRSTASVMMDWVGVLDPRDNEHFSHWRYDQDPVAFEQMLTLARNIGTYVLRDTPLDYVQAMFDNSHQLRDDDFDHLLEGDDEPL